MKLRLKQIRKKNKLTRKESADVIGVSIARYTLYENKLIRINTKELSKFCQYCNISCDYVLGLTDDYKTLYEQKN